MLKHTVQPIFSELLEGKQAKKKKSKEKPILSKLETSKILFSKISLELQSSITEMLDYDGPYLLHVRVEKEENIFPMVPSGSSVSDIRLE